MHIWTLKIKKSTLFREFSSTKKLEKKKQTILR